MSSQGVSNPAEARPVPGFPTDAGLIVFEQFTTLNTKSLRPAIKDEEMSWCDGFMPIGANNLRALYDVGDKLYSAPDGVTVAYFNFWNIKTTPYCIVIESDGSIVAINTNTAMATTIEPAGTILNPSSASVDTANWGSQYILIVANQDNGYWIWDGSVMYTSGSLAPVVEITNGGTGYADSFDVTFSGGSGSGAAATATAIDGVITSNTIS